MVCRFYFKLNIYYDVVLALEYKAVSFIGWKVLVLVESGVKNLSFDWCCLETSICSTGA